MSTRWQIIEGDAADLIQSVSFDAVVTDPPYGIGEAAGKNRSRSNATKATDYGDDDWDDKPVDQSLMDLFRSMSKYQIVFGGNYYTFPPSSCWLVWDKQNTGDFADCELAWTNLSIAVRMIRWQWNGMLRKGKEARYHPTQKPVGVMKWAMEWLPADAETILDPFCGSGTTGVAALQLGKKFIGFEKSKKWADVARERLAAEEGGTTMEAVKVGQEVLF